VKHITIETANAKRIMLVVIADALRPPPAVNYVDWAVDNITFQDNESDVPGPYNRRAFRYFDEVLRALSPEDPCRIVTLAKSAQLGGTVIAVIFTLGTMDMDPCYFFYVHPTESNAKKWSRMKLVPLLKTTPDLRSAFPLTNRDGSDSVLYKERRDGRGAIQISGANSPSNLSQVTMKRQVQDDLSKWEMNNAGDPETQADSRSRGKEFAKILKISTPLVMPGCRITRNFEEGSQEFPFVPCPHCGHMQVLEWENMLAGLDEDHPEDAHFTCIECGSIIEEHHRAEMVDKVEWRAKNPAAKRYHRSFYLWSAYSILQSWERIAREWLAAKGDPERERVFLNDTVGRAFVTNGEAPPWEGLRDRAAQSPRSRGRIPAGYFVVAIGVDCQKDRVEWQAVAFGRDYRRAPVDYGVIPGHISERDCQDRLDALLKETWLNSAGNRIGLDKLAIDGNAWTEDVWEWARRHSAQRVVMVRGLNTDVAPLTARVKKERNAKTGKLLRYSSRFYNVNVSVLKMALYRNLAKTDPLQRGFVDFPAGFEDEYFRQLTSERRIKVKTRSGAEKYEWVPDQTIRNEMLDTMNQAEAAAILWGVRSLPEAIWDRLEAERETPLPEAQLDLEDGLFGRHSSAKAAPKQPEPKVNRWRNRK